MRQRDPFDDDFAQLLQQKRFRARCGVTVLAFAELDHSAPAAHVLSAAYLETRRHAARFARCVPIAPFDETAKIWRISRCDE